LSALSWTPGLVDGMLGVSPVAPRATGLSFAMTQSSHLPRFAAVAVALAVAVAWIVFGAAAAARAARIQGPDFGRDVGAFGFAPGEERRYELGPVHLLADRDRRVTWRARLDRFETEGAEPLAVFALEYEDETVSLGPAEHQLDWLRTEGEVAVNRHGFPRWLQFTEQEGASSRTRPFEGATRWTRYSFDGDDRFEKLSRVEEKEWSVELPIARHDGLDLDVPRGLWILESSRAAFFTNPAFVDLMLPRPVQTSPERQEVLLFQPTGTDRFWDPFEARDGRQVLRDFYAHGHVERRGRERVLVGERRIEAWRIELGGVARTAWVDSDGRVVRLDLRDNPLVDATVWVRLVAPSEY